LIRKALIHGTNSGYFIDGILFALGVVKDSDGLSLHPPPGSGNSKINGAHVLLGGYLAGQFGVDRFIAGNIGLGIAKLVTLGGCGIWAMVDVILCAVGSFRDAEGNSLKWD